MSDCLVRFGVSVSVSVGVGVRVVDMVRDEVGV